MKLDNGEASEAGKGNLCSACHRARGDGQTVWRWTRPGSPQLRRPPRPAGRHARGRQRAYSSSAHTTVVRDTCVACHMALPQGRYCLSPEIGSHSFNLKGAVHDAEVLNTAACLTCHKDVAPVQGTLLFNEPADFDNDGEVEPLQLEVLVNKDGSGLLQHLSPPMYRPDGTWNVVTTPGTRFRSSTARSPRCVPRSTFPGDRGKPAPQSGGSLARLRHLTPRPRRPPRCSSPPRVRPAGATGAEAAASR